MNKKKLKSRILKNWWNLIPLTLMLAAYAILNDVIVTAINPDMSSYFGIARNYSRFQFHDALNAYWSPLISWLLAPFFAIGVGPFTSFRILMILFSIGILYESIFWANILLRNSFSKFVLCLSVASFSLLYGLTAVSPDFLSILPLLIFLRFLWTLNASIQSWMKLAVAGIFCFWAKSFLLPLILSLTGLYILFRFFIQKEKIYWKGIVSFGVLLVVFLFFWGSLLGMKYGKFKLSSTYDYNSLIYGPQGEEMHYTCYASLIKPPTEHALYGWQDPTVFPLTPRYFWKSWEGVLFQVDIWKFNARLYPYLFRFFSYFGYLALLIPIVPLFFLRNRIHYSALLLLMNFVLVMGGYTLVFFQERYLLPGQFTLMLAAFPIAEFLAVKFRTKWMGYAGVLLVGISFAKNPLGQIPFYIKDSIKCKEERGYCEDLAKSGVLNGRKVATTSNGSRMLNFISMACFYADAQSYNELVLSIPESQHLNELEKFDIETLVLNDCLPNDSIDYCLLGKDPDWTLNYPVVYKDERFRIKVVQLK